MISSLPIYVSLLFFMTVMITIFILVSSIRNSFYESTKKKAKIISYGIIIWLSFQAIMAIANTYYTDLNAFPSNIILIGIIPMIIIILLVFLIHQGRLFVDTLPLKDLTYLNLVRIPVEIILYWLFLNKAIPKLMTFEGRNFDFFAGVTSVLIIYFGFYINKISLNAILAWNFICLGLLLNIVIIAILSSPSPIQQCGFEQPNLAILYFPFIWLPTFVVPVILFGHLVSIRQILKFKKIRFKV